MRLLETLAASMSVALENARLFDETQRLLKRRTARAELARDQQHPAGNGGQARLPGDHRARGRQDP
jgi:GAF domain-containing protein